MTVSLHYEIRVSGPVPESLLVETVGLTVVAEPAQTVLRGPIPDQAALHGIINRLQRLGLELIEVRRVGQHIAESGVARANCADGIDRSDSQYAPNRSDVQRANPEPRAGPEP